MQKVLRGLVIVVVFIITISLMQIVEAASADYEIHTEVFQSWFVPTYGHKLIAIHEEYWYNNQLISGTTTYSRSDDPNYRGKPYYTDGNSITFRYINIWPESTNTLEMANASSSRIVIPDPGKKIFKVVTGGNDMTALVAKHPYRANLWHNVSITSEYGWRIHPITKVESFHTGIDYGTKLNRYDLTIPFKSGYVTFEGSPTDTEGYGLLAKITTSHGGNTYELRYAHMSSKVSDHHGKTVVINTVIGKTGTSGSSTGIHLHLEVRRNGVRINPNEIFDTYHLWGNMR